MEVRALNELLADARDAAPATRIELRDPIANFGTLAVDAMTDWLGDERLAAFAIRVLERIGQDHANQGAVLDVFEAVDRDELPPHLASDLDQALAKLGQPRAAPRAGPRSATVSRPIGLQGVAGRGYWVMRTSPWERPYIWREARAGRLLQGWGWNEEMNLDVIAEVVRRGGELSEEQRVSSRSRRMRTSAPDGVRVGDLIVAPNLPEWGRLSVFRITGSYEYLLDTPRQFGERFGHILPVELLVADIDRHSPEVSDGLRSMLGVQTRLYNISGYGGDVERLLGNPIGRSRSGDRWGELWTERDYKTLFGRFPPTGERPSDSQIAALAAELGRTFDAISWQWGDGAAYSAGRSASTTSEPLKAWLDRQSSGE